MISTAYDFEQFVRGSIWKDMQEELGVWLGEIQKSLENPEADDATLRRLQGNAETIRKVLMLPEVVIHNLKLDMEEEENERQ